MQHNLKQIRAYRVGWILPFVDFLIICPFLLIMKRKTASAVELQFLGDKRIIENDIRKGAFFMTNHRDICMDATWLTFLLRTRYFIHPYFGIGNNLFGKWWIEHLVRFLRGFVVIRNGSFHDQRQNAISLSAYIRHLRKRKKSIWLAQREGRAKDSNDITQPGVVKMLTIDAEDFFEKVKELNICPVSISYEYDPCDYLKAREMQLKRDNPKWRKSKKDDLVSMQVGINGYKGRIVYRLTPSINHDIDKMLVEHPEIASKNRNEQIQMVCQVIDQHIHRAYEMYERGADFDRYIESRLEKIHLSNKDTDYLRERLLEMYDNPVKNHMKAIQTEK